MSKINGKRGGVFSRNEGFRLSFKEPIMAEFTILKIQEKDLNSKAGIASIVDMSLHGAKIRSDLELPTPNTFVTLEFIIHEEKMNIIGELIWIKKSYNGFNYGVTFDAKSYSDKDLLTQLKNYVNNHKST